MNSNECSAAQRAPSKGRPNRDIHTIELHPMFFLYLELIHGTPVKHENSIRYVFTLCAMRFLCLFLNAVSLSLCYASQAYVNAMLFLYCYSSNSQPRSASFFSIHDFLSSAAIFFEDKSELDMFNWSDLLCERSFMLQRSSIFSHYILNSRAAQLFFFEKTFAAQRFFFWKTNQSLICSIK